MTTPDATALVHWLAHHDAQCPACDHALRGTPEPICPECGSALELGVRAPSIRHSGWVAALIACAMGFGFDAVVVTVIIWEVIIKMFIGHLAQIPTDVWMILLTLVPLALACLAGIFALWRKRHRLIVLPNRGQILIGLGAFALIGGVHAGVGVWLVAMLII
jgi:hypothetical protein